MYTNLRKLSNLFFILGAVLTFFSSVLIYDMLAMGHNPFVQSAFTTLCLVCCILAVPGLFLGLGIALRMVNKELFDNKMTLFSMNTSNKE